MSERKMVVPDGMLKAAMDEAQWRSPHTRSGMECGLEAALRWLSENPIVPTSEQAHDLRATDKATAPPELWQGVIVEWQRRMFLAPEPSAPVELNDLLWQGKVITPADESIEENDRRIIEAYRRGKESK